LFRKATVAGGFVSKSISLTFEVLSHIVQHFGPKRPISFRDRSTFFCVSP
jgi:hypothetical protein